MCIAAVVATQGQGPVLLAGGGGGGGGVVGGGKGGGGGAGGTSAAGGLPGTTGASGTTAGVQGSNATANTGGGGGGGVAATLPPGDWAATAARASSSSSDHCRQTDPLPNDASPLTWRVGGFRRFCAESVGVGARPRFAEALQAILAVRLTWAFAKPAPAPLPPPDHQPPAVHRFGPFPSRQTSARTGPDTPNRRDQPPGLPDEIGP